MRREDRLIPVGAAALLTLHVWFAPVSRAQAQQGLGLADSDGDGLADVEEDVNQNGRRDHGETDPHVFDTDGDGTGDGEERRIGTDPAHNGLLDFPEPMVFDMVRGLGAEQGEVEINVLALVPTSPAAVNWAPEIEAAVVDNFAVELEAGFHNDEFELIKLALQGTVAMDEGHGIGHGLQGLVEYLREPDTIVATALYILGVGMTRSFSLVSLIGPAIETHLGEGSDPGFFGNFTLFWAPHPRVVVGSEQNFEWFPDFYLIRWMPQVHWQATVRFQWQAGFGLLHLDGRNSAEAATRLIVEF